ncbi:2002_t:CDS:10 [Acaulospora morrowiae]|uniref:2002_t:CDS:1 n=1 Tax=Acaulospora morrowiae TaxID=94023 RepID=A0A9N9GD00_9GLOM|nr:2002_t:CDS:10 [Acaulospora morrowiae]
MDPFESSNGTSFTDNTDNLNNEELSNPPPSVDFYGVLNVSKEATDEEIKDSYKRLCRIFHPDKHIDPESRKAAQSKFQVIQKAYEGKTIYDMFGEEGLSTSWEIGARYKTSQELREEFERQTRAKREQEVESMVKSKGDLQLSIDATQMFDPYDRGPRSWYENIEITQLFLKHSFENQLQPQTQASFVGQTVLRNGVGGGNIMWSLRHAFSPNFWAEVGSSIIQPRVMNVKTNYSFGSDGFFSVVAQSHTIKSPPSLSFTGGRRLGANTSGYLTYRTGAWSLGPWGQKDFFSRRDKSAVAIGLSSSKENSGYACEIQTGLGESHVSANYNYKLLGDYHLKAATTLSTSSGLTAVLFGERKITENTRLALAMEFGIPNGVLFRCRISRLGQRITIPIQISSEYNHKFLLWGALLPVVTMFAVERAVLMPRRKKKAAERLATLRERNAEHIANRKREAEEAIRLLQPTVGRKLEAEKTKENGLVILEAWYGNLSRAEEPSSSPSIEGIFDVRIPVQALVHDSQLTIPGGYSKSNIIGFYDPCLGEPKQLKIRYQFQRKIHEVVVNDTHPVACPLRWINKMFLLRECTLWDKCYLATRQPIYIHGNKKDGIQCIRKASIITLGSNANRAILMVTDLVDADEGVGDVEWTPVFVDEPPPVDEPDAVDEPDVVVNELDALGELDTLAVDAPCLCYEK